LISAIIPTLNEKKNIEALCKKLSCIRIVSEVIFVDDNSEDGTFKEIQKMSILNKKFIGILRDNKEKNLSASVLAGVFKAKNRLILVMDSDLQHNTSYILKMYQSFQKNSSDIVIASRFLNNNITGNLGLIRSILSNFCIFLINSFFKKKTSDPLSGFFLCKKSMIIKEYKKFYLRGFKILFDILYNGRRYARCEDIPIVFDKRKYEKTKFNYKIIIIFIKQLIYTFGR
jgi:dolichol-phosphate mannosyltransferase